METMDKDGNISKTLGYGFGSFGNKKDIQKQFDNRLFEQTLKNDKQYIADFNKMVKEQGMTVAEAASNMTLASQSAKEYCVNTNEATRSGADYEKQQRKLRDSNKKTAKGFKGLSTNVKALLGNVGITAAISFGLNVLGKGISALDDKLKISKSSKLEAMQNAITKYNDAISESADNTKTIKSLSAEFNTLSKGVDENGKNIGLTADEYSRYNEIVRQLADLNPDLVKGYTAEGNAIVDRNTAIRDSIKLQKQYAEEATAKYVKTSTGNDIVKGARANASTEMKNLQAGYKDIAKLLDDAKKIEEGNVNISTKQGQVPGKASELISDYIGHDVVAGKVALKDLETIVTDRDKIIQKAKKSGNYSKAEIRDLQDELSSLSGTYSDYQDSFEPIYQWLSTAMSSVDKETGKAISSTVPKALRDGYEDGLKQISSSGVSAGEMKGQAEKLANTLSENYKDNTDSIRDILAKARQAKEDFLNSDKSKSEAKATNETLVDQAEALEKLAKKYETTDAALSAFYQSQATSMRNFVKENELSIANSFGAFDDMIEAARNAKTEYDEAMSGGDYYTGIDAYKEIYNTMFNGKNNLGNGSQGFWQGAKQILGTDYLRKVGYDIDTVKGKMKDMQPLLEGGAKGASLFAEKLLAIGDGNGSIKNDLGEEIGKVADTANGITFDIPREHLDEVAAKLGVSSEMLTAMVDSARQFSNVNFYNVDEVAKAAKQAAKDGENALTGLDKNTYLDYGKLSEESGLKDNELAKLITQLDKVGVKVIDAKENIDTLKDKVKQIGAFGSDGKLNFNKAVEQFHAMGTSADDTMEILRRLQKEGGVEINKDDFTIDDVLDKYNDLEESTQNEIVIKVRTQVQGINDLKSAIDGIEGLSGDEKSGIAAAAYKFEMDGDIEAYAKEINKLPDKKRTEVLCALYGADEAEEFAEVLDAEDKKKHFWLAEVDVNEDKLKQGLDDIDGLSDNNKKIVIDAVAEFEESGNLSVLTEMLADIPDKKRVEVIAELVNSGALDTFLSGLDDDEKKVMIDFLTSGEGDVKEVEGIIDKLPEDVQTQVQALVDYVLGSQENPNDASSNVDYKKGKQESPSKGNTSVDYSTIGMQIDPATGQSSVYYKLGGQEAPKNKTATVTYTIKQVVGKIADIASGNVAKGTSGRRKRSNFASMAGGGRLGPNGNGGLTLAGELGTELVWIPSESRSFLVGQFGPEMVNLPSEAVVYPADETRRILGDTLPLFRYNFGSLAAGTEFGSMASAGGTIPRYTGARNVKKKKSSSSKSSGKSSSSKKSSSKSSSSSSDSESAYEKAKKKIDHELSMGYLTESAYYTELSKLQSKYKKDLAKNVDDERKALEDLRKAWIDAYEAASDSLQHQLEMGTINEEQYYNKLKALGDQYYKGRKGYTKEYEKHLEELKDARKDAYDAQLDDLQRQLELEKITIENYYNQVANLQNKWLTGPEMKKDREEALKDLLDDLVDEMEDKMDDVDQLISDKDLFKAWTPGEDAVDDWKKFLAYLQGPDIKNMFYALEGGEKAYGDLILKVQREIQEALNDRYDDEKDQLDEIMDLVESLVRQETEDKIDALEEQIDKYSEIIDKKKKSLQMTEDELDYIDEMNDLASQIAKKQAEIAVLSRDDSRAGRSKLAEAQEELADLLKQQQQTQRDETLDRTEDMLDDQDEKFEEALQKQIEKLQDFLDNKSAVLEEVIKQIENRDTNKLYDRLMEYNSKYGDGLIKTVTDFWDDLTGLTKKYGNDIEKIVELLQKGTDDGKTGGIIPAHHSGLATGFTGDGADLKQHEVYRLLTDDELVLNRNDQMRLANQLGVLESITSTYGGMLSKVSPQNMVSAPSTIELSVNTPITIEGGATPEAIKQLNKVGEQIADNAIERLNDALRMNGVRTGAKLNVRKK